MPLASVGGGGHSVFRFGLKSPTETLRSKAPPATVAIFAGVIKRACHAGEDLKMEKETRF